MLKTEIISISGVLFSGEASQVVVPTITGEIGFMQGCESIVCDLKEGNILILDKDEKIVQEFPIKGGFMSMNEGSSLRVLIDQ
jgi:F0F1-type ATP synthase epsilon subunit